MGVDRHNAAVLNNGLHFLDRRQIIGELVFRDDAHPGEDPAEYFIAKKIICADIVHSNRIHARSCDHIIEPAAVVRHNQIGWLQALQGFSIYLMSEYILEIYRNEEAYRIIQKRVGLPYPASWFGS